MRRLVLALLGAALLATAPNTLWLVRSTAVVRSHSAVPLGLSIVVEDEGPRSTDLGTLSAGDARFLWVEARGEATLFVEVVHEGDRHRHCGEYVEAAMYHVEVVILAPDEVICHVELPLLDRLLLLDLLRAQL